MTLRRKRATFVMVFAGVYLLWMFQRVVFTEPSEFLLKLGHHLTDIDRVEILTLAPLFALTILIGVYPALVLDFIQAPVAQILSDLGAPMTASLP